MLDGYGPAVALQRRLAELRFPGPTLYRRSGDGNQRPSSAFAASDYVTTGNRLSFVFSALKIEGPIARRACRSGLFNSQILNGGTLDDDTELG
jgi:hypothetical protein